MGALRAVSEMPGLALTFFAISFAAFVVIVGVAAMVAIWHPAADRRAAAYRVLDRLLRVLPTGDRSRRRTSR